MPRPQGELIATGITTPFATLYSLYSGALATVARPDVLNKLYRIWTDAKLDFLGRHSIPPFDNLVSEKLLFKLSGLLPEKTQVPAIYVGFALNVLSMMGHATSNRDSSATPKKLITEIAATFSLAITPSLLLSTIAQLDYLKTATHLGTAEAVITLLPNLLIMAPALLKIPSVVRGAGYVVKKVVIEPIRGSINTKRRIERQQILNTQQAENRTIGRQARLFTKVAQALEEQRFRRQARMNNSLPEVEVSFDRLNAQAAEHLSRINPIIPNPIYERLHAKLAETPPIADPIVLKKSLPQPISNKS